jgi:hypothetical protein
LRSFATPSGDGTWRIKGTKIFISFGDHDMTPNIVHLVLARTPDAPPGTKGISLFIVPKYRLDANGNPGAFNDVRPVSLEHKMGIHASPTCVMSFGEQDDCVGEMLGPLHGGMRAMFTMMNNARLNIGLQGVQTAEAATQRALAFAAERVQLEPIIRHPDVRRMLMRMRALTQAVRALTYYAFGQLDRAALGNLDAGLRCALLTPLVKAYATDVGTEVASLALQVHGGMGYIEETGIAQLYRDIRIAAIYEGTNGIQAADFVGRKLLGDGGAAFSRLMTDMRAEAEDEPNLLALLRVVKDSAHWSIDADAPNRLASSYPLLTMTAVAVSGWLMKCQHRIAAELQAEGDSDDAYLGAKQGVTRYYLDIIVPEAMGLAAAARAGAAGLYALDDEILAA